jgi:hypothetical protein
MTHSFIIFLTVVALASPLMHLLETARGKPVPGRVYWYVAGALSVFVVWMAWRLW